MPSNSPSSPLIQPTDPAGDTTERFRLLVESVKDYAIFILDPLGHVSTWNAGAERIKGYRASEIIGKHFSVFYPAHVASTGRCEKELEVAAREGRFEAEGWRLRQDGSRFWANVTITALRKPEGTLIGFAKVTRDLTERKELEDDMRNLAAQRAALAEKAQIQRFQERFLAVLGHDLRNPLASIDLGAGILRQQMTDPSMLRILERMNSSSRRMARMIEQILDLTQSSLRGGLEVNAQPMELRDALTPAIDKLRAAYPHRTIELVGSSLPGSWDRGRLEHVFSNLIGNALLHGDAETPVSVHAYAEGETIRVDVHNEGPPIPEELQVALFDPFRKDERDGRTPKTAGLGLGLYISQEAVLAHGGKLEVQSNPADGTTFQVTLPRAMSRVV